jgi:hypothetical protein
MIITEQKQFEEVLRYLEGRNRVFLIGCGVCAATWRTGGEPEVRDMATRLAEVGKTCTGWLVTKEACCDARLTRRDLKQHAAELDETDAVLVMACGAGTQTVAGLIEQPVLPGLNTIALARINSLSLAYEKCRLCGDCILAETGGICPVTLCPKGLMNGPCGGYRDGKCEVDPANDCAWVLIYQRLAQLGQAEQFAKIRPPKDWSRMRNPRTIDKRAVQSDTVTR